MNLNQVTVPVLDVARSIAFYTRLGLRLIVHTHDGYARFECPEGEATFSVHRVDALPQGEGVTIYFELDDLDEQVAVLVAGGMVFDQMPVDQSWLWREAQLRDPDGNRLILYRAGKHRRYPPWRKTTN